MLKKLRLRFVCINMAIVLCMLCVIFGMVLHFTRQNLTRESISMMQSVADDPMQLNWPGISSARLPYFTVRLSPYGGVRAIGTSYYDLTDPEFLSQVVNTALNSREESGVLPEYSLRYYRTARQGAKYIIFADVSSEGATMRSLRKNCAVIGGGSLPVFLVISLLLARWAVKPVDKAWAQQKQFVSDASHELKTPLTVILTNAELLGVPGYSEEQKNRFAESILTMANQMRGLVDGLLELARVDNGAVRTAFAPVDLSALTESAILPFEALFFEKSLTLETHIQPGITCKGSDCHLRQVVETLLDNAQKYAVPGAVTVSLQRQGRGRCLLQVVTPGEPLSTQECRDIFKRFYRADKVRAMEHSYGLGLAIAQSIVQEHNGRIWCESLDSRNIFSVQLPTD